MPPIRSTTGLDWAPGVRPFERRSFAALLAAGLARATLLDPIGLGAAAPPTAADACVSAPRLEVVPGRVSATILVTTLGGAVTFPLTAWMAPP